jgi:hypothetical protein
MGTQSSLQILAFSKRYAIYGIYYNRRVLEKDMSVRFQRAGKVSSANSTCSTTRKSTVSQNGFIAPILSVQSHLHVNLDLTFIYVPLIPMNINTHAPSKTVRESSLRKVTCKCTWEPILVKNPTGVSIAQRASRRLEIEKIMREDILIKSNK